MIPIIGLTWCIPCVTIAKGDISTSPSDSSSSSSSAASTISVSGKITKSGSGCSTVIKTVATTSTSNSVITLKQKRSGSLTSNCSHALKCNNTSAITSSSSANSNNSTITNFRENDFTKNNGHHLLMCSSSNNNINKITSNNSTSEINNKLRPCIKHHNPAKNKLSYSYDDLLSVSNSSSGTTTYGFVSRPSALKRSSSTNNKRNITTTNNNNHKTRETNSDTNTTTNQRYSTNSLCSNKSVKFNLPLIQQHQFHENFRENNDFTKKIESSAVVANPDHHHDNLTEKKFLNHMSSYFFRGPIPSGFPPGSYFMYQNYCTNCGMCPFSGNNGAATTTIRPPEVMSNNPVNTNPASATSNFQLATWFQTQNFYQFHQQQQNNDESGPFYFTLSLINIHTGYERWILRKDFG